MADNYSVRDGNGALLTQASTDLGSSIHARKVRLVDASGNAQPAGDAATRPVFVTLADGTVALLPVAAALADAFANPTTSKIGVCPLLYNGTTWDRQRTPAVFKVVALGAGTTETTIWTPAGGKKFRLMGFVLTCGAGSTLTFKDNTAGTTIFASRGTTDQPIRVDLGNGILSGSANNVFTVTRGTSCTLDGVVWGTEE